MKKVVVFTTGGTIAMKYDEKQGGLVPAVSGEDSQSSSWSRQTSGN